jgi:hypothetical protein
MATAVSKKLVSFFLSFPQRRESRMLIDLRENNG